MLAENDTDEHLIDPILKLGFLFDGCGFDDPVKVAGGSGFWGKSQTGMVCFLGHRKTVFDGGRLMVWPKAKRAESGQAQGLRA